MTESQESPRESSALRVVRVLVVDDHPIVRHGLRTLLEAAGDFTVAAEVGRAYEALEALEKLAVDAVLLDVALPDLNGIEVLRIIRKTMPRLPVLVLSVYEEELYAVRAMQEGASGYLTKNSAAQQLVEAMRKIVAGGLYITPSLAEKLASSVNAAAPGQRPHEKLSLRELEVLRLIAQGKTLKSISELLHLSPKTISTYRTRILEKMKMQTNEDLARYALANDLIG